MSVGRSTLIALGTSCLGILAGYGMHALAEGAPTKQPLFYSGTLEQDGTLANGDYTITVTFHDAASAGTQLCSSQSQVTAREGRFRADVSECAGELTSNPDVWTAVGFMGSDGVQRKISGRSKIGAVPYALEAQHAVSASAANGALASTISALTDRIAALEGASASKSAFQAFKTSAQTLSAGSSTIFFDEEQYDFGDEFDPTTSVFTTKLGGEYEFSCTVAWNIPTQGTIGQWEASLQLNGYERIYNGFATDGSATTRQVQGVIKLSPGDRVNCAAYQEPASEALNVSGYYITFEGRRFAQ